MMIIQPPPLTEQEEEQLQQEINAAQQAIAESHPASDSPILTSAGTIVLLPKSTHLSGQARAKH